jgi:hypothetical protein
VAEDLVHESAALPAPHSIAERHHHDEERRLHRWRFAIAYFALAVVAGAAVGGAIVAYDRAPADAGVAWSAWKPEGSEFSYPRQIANFIAPRYKLQSGNQLVAVTASKPEIPTEEGAVPITHVAIVNDRTGDDIDMHEADNTVMYQLCGLGASCSIREGEASPERLQLLGREALELALYSFKYGDGISSVLALLPTNLVDPENPSDDQTIAMYFRKGDFATELGRPLNRTLSLPGTLAQIPAAEREKISRLTAPRFFQYSFQQTQVPNGAIVILAPAA